MGRAPDPRPTGHPPFSRPSCPCPSPLSCRRGHPLGRPCSKPWWEPPTAERAATASERASEWAAPPLGVDGFAAPRLAGELQCFSLQNILRAVSEDFSGEEWTFPGHLSVITVNVRHFQIPRPLCSPLSPHPHPPFFSFDRAGCGCSLGGGRSVSGVSIKRLRPRRSRCPPPGEQAQARALSLRGYSGRPASLQSGRRGRPQAERGARPRGKKGEAARPRRFTGPGPS